MQDLAQVRQVDNKFELPNEKLIKSSLVVIRNTENKHPSKRRRKLLTTAERVEKILMRKRIGRKGEKELLRLIPELKDIYFCSQKHPAHCCGVWKHTIKVIEGLPRDVSIRYTALLHDIGKPSMKKKVDGIERFKGHEEVSVKIADKILNGLGYKREFIDKILVRIKYHDTKTEPTMEGVKEMVGKLGGYENYGWLLKHQVSDLVAHSKWYARKKMPSLKEVIAIYQSLRPEHCMN